MFKRKYQAVTLQDKPTIVDIETGQISIDPQRLFQRFIVAADSIYEDKAAIFAYELSGQPISMFDSSGFMRSAQKSTLVDANRNVGDCSAEYKENSYNYVVDGGSLMHKIPWKYWSTFGINIFFIGITDIYKQNNSNSTIGFRNKQMLF